MGALPNCASLPQIYPWMTAARSMVKNPMMLCLKTVTPPQQTSVRALQANERLAQMDVKVKAYHAATCLVQTYWLPTLAGMGCRRLFEGLSTALGLEPSC